MTATQETKTKLTFRRFIEQLPDLVPNRVATPILPLLIGIFGKRTPPVIQPC